MKSIFYASTFILFLCLAACGNSNNENSNATTPENNVVKTVVEDETMPAPPNQKFTDTVFEVADFQQFYNAIGSHRTLVLKNNITLPENIKGDKNINVDMDFGVIIRGLSNLKITSQEGQTFTITQPNPAYKVLKFYGCENIVLENIKAGHDPLKGYCSATVIDIENSQKFFIINSLLFGSGYESITTFKVKGLFCQNTKFYENSFSIMSLSQSQDLKFFDCKFVDNNEPSGSGQFYFAKSENILIQGGEIANNARYIGEPNQLPFFQIDDCDDVVIRKTHIHNNKAGRFIIDSASIKLQDVKFENNSWDVQLTAAK